MFENRIVLLDGDVKRRAEITHLLLAGGFIVEPFENIGDFEAYPVEAKAFLVADGHCLGAAFAAILSRCDSVPTIIAYRESPAIEAVVEAMRAGAATYLAWPFDSAKLEETLAGQSTRQSEIGSLRNRILRAKRKLESLTEREQQVLQLIGEGLSSKEAALELDISPRTVDIHRANMMTKLQTRNAAQLVRIMVESSFEDVAGPQLAMAA